MEPTIYKPSIYKGAGIYKNGAEGGGGVVKFIPFCSDIRTSGILSSSLYIEDNFLKKTEDNKQGLYLGGLPFSSCNEFEIKIKFKYYNNTSTYSQIIGEKYTFWRSPTIWRVQYSDGKSHIAFGVPNGNDSWNGSFIDVIVELGNDDFCTIIAKCNNVTKKITLDLWKNDSFVGSNELICNNISYSRYVNDTVMLDGGNQNNHNHYFCGEIDLNASYIRCDDLRYF